MAEPGRRRRRATGCAAAVGALAAVTAGCAGIPTSGAAHAGRVVSVTGTSDEPPVGLIGALPTPGMSATQTVRGFLRAQAVGAGEADVARAYLGGPLAGRWQPGSTITVYDDTASRLHSEPHDRVRLVAPSVGTIGADGQWSAGGRRLSVTFSLTRAGGRWRIVGVPDRDLLGRTDLDGLYQEYELSYLDPTGTRQVTLPSVQSRAEPGLATALVRALLSGPPGLLAGAVTTAIPPGTQLFGNVAVDPHGTADVDLTGQLRQAPASRLRLILDQLLLTLGQVPGVTGVQLSVDGVRLAVPGVTSRQPLSAARVFASSVTAGDLAVAAPDGRARTVAGVSTAVHPGPPQRAFTVLGRSWPDVSSLAWTRQGTAVAVAGRSGHQRLLSGGVAGTPRRVWRASTLGSLQAVGDDAIAVADGSRLLRVHDGRARPVTLPPRIAAAGVRAVALAPDGVKVAALIGSPGRERLYTAALRPDGRLVGLSPLALRLHSGRGLSWAASDLIATTALTGGRRAVLEVDPAGFSPRQLALPRRVAAVADLCGAPGSDLAVVSNGRLWLQRSAGWSPVARATGCSYAS
jgi:hypothetical protein